MTTRSEFGFKTEASDVVSTFSDSVRGKTILITGVGPNGLGATLAHALASQAPKLLILTGRTPSKVEAITKEIAAKYPDVKTRILKLDMASFSSISAAADAVHAYTEPSIDILINNAGVMNIPERTLSADGFEMQLAVNYLGLALFTNSIMLNLLKSNAGRVVNIVSNGYALSPFRFSDYNFEGKSLPEDEQPPKGTCEAFGVPWGLDYIPPIAYGQSKTAAMLYTIELATRLKDKGVSTVCLNPGAIATDLWRQMPQEFIDKIFQMMPMKSKAQGASTPLVAALDPKLAGSSGVYLDDCQIADVAPWAKDADKAQKLWTLTEELTGKPFSW
ncbi:MAG: hypothetical protein M1830_007425 [Pleopsidium flavum]|nr:MAG: hypothetical protein M1830_007425 [Pleopsidium flavum]